jgi:crotonobetainyl-CoA:carnitine CoA-transferase CaiB-like acyl-CoA transferase
MDSNARRKGPLGGVRIIECSMLGPGGITTHLADLGAEVIKVEPPSGDYIREMTWPWVEGVSLMHLHISRGKRSIVLDLRTEEGKETFLDLVRGADAVVEAMRPGGLERRGVGYEACKAVNPKIVFCCISGYGATGPYRDLPSHGIAYDTWAGLVDVETTPEGFTEMPAHPNVGINVGPLFGALGILAGITQARETGQGCFVELAQSDAAAVMDWLAPETYKAYERPESEVTGNRSDGYARREPGTAGMKGGVRYQIYESSDGHVLFMASEKAFWKNFCEGVDRADLFEAHPGATYADHARGDLKLRAELTGIFKTRSTQEWIAFGIEVNTPIAPVNTPQTIADDPQFIERLPWIPADVLGCEQLPTPLKFDVELPQPTMAPTLGQHTDDVLSSVLGYDDETIAAKRKSGAFGPPADDAGGGA